MGDIFSRRSLAGKCVILSNADSQSVFVYPNPHRPIILPLCHALVPFLPWLARQPVNACGLDIHTRPNGVKNPNHDLGSGALVTITEQVARTPPLHTIDIRYPFERIWPTLLRQCTRKKSKRYLQQQS